MAVGQNQRNRKNDSMLTKTGKARLGPLNTAQLSTLLEKSTKPKEKAKIQHEAVVHLNALYNYALHLTMNPLTLEDILHTEQRSKLEDFESSL